MTEKISHTDEKSNEGPQNKSMTTVDTTLLTDGGQDAAKVIGHNTDEDGETYGVWGEVDSGDGYGLGTPNNAEVGGVLEAAGLAGPVTGDEELTDLVGDGLTIDEGSLSATGGGSITPGRYLASNAELDFTGPAEWENVGETETNQATGEAATVAGGQDNEASDDRATIGGGGHNIADASHATVAGGENNTASGDRSTVAGGFWNVAGGTDGGGTNWTQTVSGGRHNEATARDATVGGGQENTASGQQATVSGGRDNTASGDRATVPGGRDNTASGEFSFAAGHKATAQHSGSIVFGDSSETEVSSDGKDEARFQMEIVAEKGVDNQSASAAKTNIDPVDPQHILDGVRSFDVSTWEYTDADGEGNGRTHIGPMAEDFHDAFEIGDMETINSIDSGGVAFAAIQGLAERLEEAREELATKAERIAELEEKAERIDDLEERLKELEG